MLPVEKPISLDFGAAVARFETQLMTEYRERTPSMAVTVAYKKWYQHGTFSSVILFILFVPVC